MKEYESIKWHVKTDNIDLRKDIRKASCWIYRILGGFALLLFLVLMTVASAKDAIDILYGFNGMFDLFLFIVFFFFTVSMIIVMLLAVWSIYRTIKELYMINIGAFYLITCEVVHVVTIPYEKENHKVYLMVMYRGQEVLLEMRYQMFSQKKKENMEKRKLQLQHFGQNYLFPKQWF